MPSSHQLSRPPQKQYSRSQEIPARAPIILIDATLCGSTQTPEDTQHGALRVGRLDAGAEPRDLKLSSRPPRRPDGLLSQPEDGVIARSRPSLGTAVMHQCRGQSSFLSLDLILPRECSDEGCLGHCNLGNITQEARASIMLMIVQSWD